MNTKVDELTSVVEVVNTSVTNLTGQVNRNSDDINKIKKQLADSKSNTATDLKREVRQVIEELNITSPPSARIAELSREVEQLKTRSGASPATNQLGSSSGEDRSYWQARKAIRVWPVKGTDNAELWKNTGIFFFETLSIPESELSEDSVISVRRVSIGRRKAARVHDEVIVMLNNVETRDMIYTYAPNLANSQGRAGMRMEIPCHLLGKFKRLSQFGRTRKEKSGQTFKWNIKFDDITQSLAIDVKYPDASSWQRVPWDQIALEECKNAPGTTSFRERFGSHASSASPSGSGDDTPDVEMVEDRRDATRLPLPQSAKLIELDKKKKKTEWGRNK